MRSGDVAIGETCALGSHAVDVWGFDIFFHAHAGEIGVAVVIAEEDDDVGFLSGERCEEEGEIEG